MKRIFVNLQITRVNSTFESMSKLMESISRVEDKHTCSTCDKQFSTKQNLNLHIQFHTGRYTLVTTAICVVEDLSTLVITENT